jgi:thiamine-monophosphate kinase
MSEKVNDNNKDSGSGRERPGPGSGRPSGSGQETGPGSGRPSGSGQETGRGQGPAGLLTDIASLGEFGLIDRLTENIRIYHKETIKGVGDDTAVVGSGDSLSLITKDLLVEGIHFDMVYTPLRHLGYKAVTVNLSDIYAMNGMPMQIIVGLAVSSKYSLEALEELYEGMLLACNKYKVDMVGGDTTSSPYGMTLSITAVGQVGREKLTYRSGASVNDILCVSGDLGAAYCGLLVLEREKAVYKANPEMQPTIGDYAYVLERQLKPEPRRDIVEMLDKAGVVPTSMIDVSDGLASETLHLCKNSRLGATLFEEKIPVDRRMAQVAHEFQIDPTTAALSGGEDYELLFTVKPSDYEKIKDQPGISPVGFMTEKSLGAQLITTSGQQVELLAQGWDALRRRK